MVSSWELIIRLWPAIVSLFVAISAAALALYRINVLYKVIFGTDGTLKYYTKGQIDKSIADIAALLTKDVNGARASLEKDVTAAMRKACLVNDRLERDEEAYLTRETHTSLCTIAQLETGKLIDAKLSEMRTEIADMLAKHQTETLRAIRGILKENGSGLSPK